MGPPTPAHCAALRADGGHDLLGGDGRDPLWAAITGRMVVGARAPAVSLGAHAAVGGFTPF